MRALFLILVVVSSSSAAALVPTTATPGDRERAIAWEAAGLQQSGISYNGEIRWCGKEIRVDGQTDETPPISIQVTIPEGTEQTKVAEILAAVVGERLEPYLEVLIKERPDQLSVELAPLKFSLSELEGPAALTFRITRVSLEFATLNDQELGETEVVALLKAEGYTAEDAQSVYDLIQGGLLGITGSDEGGAKILYHPNSPPPTSTQPSTTQPSTTQFKVKMKVTVDASAFGKGAKVEMEIEVVGTGESMLADLDRLKEWLRRLVSEMHQS
jgi:hypothetical protein